MQHAAVSTISFFVLCRSSSFLHLFNHCCLFFFPLSQKRLGLRGPSSQTRQPTLMPPPRMVLEEAFRQKPQKLHTLIGKCGQSPWQRVAIEERTRWLCL